MSTAISPKRVVFTGGSGIVGRHVISGLLSHGYEILNVDLVPLDNQQVHTIRADLTQSGQVFNVLSSHFRVTEPFLEAVKTPDAVIHFAGVPRNLLVSDDELFRINTQSAYNVIEAACKMGVKKIILASSATIYGVTFAEGHIDYPSFPIDETLDVNPMDTYAMSKLCMERVARSFAHRFGIDIYVLRICAVIPPDGYENQLQKYIADPHCWKAHAWSYTDVTDLAHMCGRCIEVDGLGFQVFNATNDEITCDVPTEEFLRKTCPNTPFTRSMGEREAPLTNKKMKELLGFQESHNWSKYFSSSR